MSVGDFVANSLSGAWEFALGLIAWIVILPIAALIPRQNSWIAVIGREDGKFIDNTKYFFLQGAPLLQPAVRTVFVTERQDVIELLAGTGYEAMRYPTLPCIWFLMRCNVAVVDSSEWYKGFRRFLLVRARIVQLWHGVGFKRIGFDQWKHQASASRVLSWPGVRTLRHTMQVTSGRLVRFDLVNTTSTFYRDAVFKGAFPSREFSTYGYPRNTFGELGDEAKALAWKNVDHAIFEQLPAWLASGRRIILIAPTFRDSRAAPMGLSPDVVDMLDAFCDENAVELVFKFHPFERSASDVNGRHLHLCAPDSDLYPLMPVSYALITDYSSIYMDYLLLDKQVFFLVPDLEEYVRQDRQFQFDFDEMTPGPKLDSWKALIDAILAQWEQDDYSDARAKIRRMAFDGLPQHDAVPSLITFMREQKWIPQPSQVQPSILRQ